MCGFVTNQCYSAIIDQFGNRIVRNDYIDPDFFNASRKYFELFLKVFRAKMNIWGEDIYQHKCGFAIFASIINLLIVLIILIFPVTHLFLTVSALLHISDLDWNFYGKLFLIIAISIINLGGLVMVIGMSTTFNFTRLENQPVIDSKTVANEDTNSSK